MDKPVIVLGLGPSGLFVTRMLRHLTHNIYGVGRHDDVGMYSKYIQKNKRHIAETEQDLINVFNRIYQSETSTPTLYICSDQYITMLLTIRTQINNDFNLFGADVETLELINNKSLVNDYCAKSGILIPRTYLFTEFVDMPEKKFPIIIKWREKRLNNSNNPIGKIKICNDELEFDKLHENLKQSRFDVTNLFVQTYVRGNNECQYSVGGIYKNGKLLAGVPVRQSRQFPQGISAEVVMVNNSLTENLMRLSCRFAENISFSGFLEMEYKVDSQSNDIFLLDINPRPWGWVSILGKAFKDFHKVFEGMVPEPSPLSVLWTSSVRKILSFRNKKNAKVLKPAKYQQAFDIWDPDDIIPSFAVFIMALKKIFRR